MPRDRDIEGETIEECFDVLRNIWTAQVKVANALGALANAKRRLATFADPDHQWYDEVGAPAHEFVVKAHKEAEHAKAQLARFEIVWQNRLNIARSE